MIPALISVIIAFGIIALSVTQITISNFSIVGNTIKGQQAFNVAEAGVNYYLWHLNHNNTDYKDGKTTPTTPDAALGYGPYVHTYIDSDGVNEGTYTLWIKPASTGSTVVTVRSIGQTPDGIKKTVEAQIGSPSFASYGVVSDGALWFGNTEEANGPVHSNQGIRMDGANTSTVSSSNTTYVPPNGLGDNGTNSHTGVWCSTTITAPVNCNTRSKSDWLYPVAAVDFNQVTSSLCTIKKVAFAANASTASLATQANACTQVPTTRTSSYLPQRSTTYSLSRGYMIQLNTNGTYDLSYVNGETDTATPYTAALSLQSVATGIAIPSSGVIFAEDNVWVRSNPTYHGRVTVAAGKLASTTPSKYANIVIADQLLYSTKNGTDAIGLVAQDSVVVAPYAPPATGPFTFEVDAAVLAQSGDVVYTGKYRSNSTRCTRGWTNANQQFVFYGSVATRQTWTWTWLVGGACGDAAYDATNGYISGIENNSTQYDYNLQYGPPPSYPLTAGYNFLSWRQVLTHP
ncbi:MAG: hypothetical protein JWL89_177 [Candidatus Saccharibacteria bacterium]|nr:hypothetical protein [Candidatus Saccharibacteria bacterium]